MARNTARPRPLPAPALLPVLLALLLALVAGCGGGEDTAQEGASDGAPAAPSAPSDNPLAGDSPLESESSPLGGDDAPSNSAGSDSGGGDGAGDLASESSAATGSASAEDAPDVSGGWSGTATDDTGEESRLQFDIEQNGATLSATAYIRGDGDDEATPIEPLTGSVTDAGTVELALESSQGEGSLSFAGTLDGSAISGESTLTQESDSGGQQTDQASFVVSRTSAQ